MTQAKPRTTKELFRAWRSGDAAAGQTMAQRFADWFFAVSTARLGESLGRGPCEAACNRFGAEIIEVTESRALVGWAHDLLMDEVAKVEDSMRSADEAGAYTCGKAPGSLLRAARSALPEPMSLLAAVYAGATPTEIEALAAPLGGIPVATLTARYQLKRWLRDEHQVPFEIVPDAPNLDRAPMPLYESDTMKRPNEAARFEQWMLTDLDLCKDITEFAHFAMAMRAGAIARGPTPAPPPPAPEPRVAPHTPSVTDTPDAPEPLDAGSGGGLPWVAIGLGVMGLIALIAGAAFWAFG